MHENEAIKRMCLCRVTINVMQWFEAPDAVDVSIYDQTLFKKNE